MNLLFGKSLPANKIHDSVVSKLLVDDFVYFEVSVGLFFGRAVVELLFFPFENSVNVGTI